jgi:LysM repeat protein
MKRISQGLIIGLLSFLLVSCARAPVKPAPSPVVVPPSLPQTTIPKAPTSALRCNVTHIVAPGETVWRISKMYDVSIAEIIRVNRLKNSSEIKMGQRLCIPQAAPIQSIVTLYPSKKWKYIIIHHSATDAGNALGFHRFHEARGFNRGLGYHFVIDNGSQGKKDGHIEASPRWIKQEDGAHCKAGHMNPRAIGVCLVGNFNSGRVTKAQMDSLIYLINRLRKYYKIPKGNILGHGQVKGARTECPGKKFPWKEFWSKL